jgi:hypothetical protein
LDFTKLALALVNVSLFAFVRSNKCLVNASILEFKLLQVVDVDN